MTPAPSFRAQATEGFGSCRIADSDPVERNPSSILGKVKSIFIEKSSPRGGHYIGTYAARTQGWATRPGFEELLAFSLMDGRRILEQAIQVVLGPVCLLK